MASIGFFIADLKRRLRYAFQWDNHLEILEEAVVQLRRERDRVKQSVAEATLNGGEISAVVTWWQSAVEERNLEFEKLIQRKEEAKKVCCARVCPNLLTRYWLGKKAHENASFIRSLVELAEGLNLDPVCPPLEQIVEPSVPLKSRRLMLNQIMDALEDPLVNVIGVHGVEGVGKTMLAKEVQAKAMQEKMFECVVLVAVSQTPEVGRIQTEIADFLGLQFDNGDVPGRASQLHRRLRDSKVLIILDDLRQKLDLNAIGIPSGNSPQNCKLLLASRSMDVLGIEMGTQEDFSLGVLGEEEACKLFCAIASESLDFQFQDIANEISKQCSGLPRSINKVAKEFRKMSMQQSVDTHQRVNDFLLTSSENQQGKEMKSLLLLCLMFGQSNIEIRRLLMYSMGLSLFEHTDTIRGARHRLFTLINKLKYESLLFDGDMDGFVKMDDADRKAAISNASLHHVFVGTGQVQFRDQLDQKCTKISLPYCGVSQLPSSLDCPEADLFLLFTKDLGLKMSHLFFEKMRNLKVVDFTGMCFTSPPLWLSLLTNLQTLSLQKCLLHNVSFIGKLKTLQQLSFAYSRIDRLPEEIQELTQLKLLDLSNCTLLQVIPAYVLSELCHLEELYMLASFKRWGTEGNASLEELKNLKKLSSLEIQIENPNLIPGGLGFFDDLELNHFRISISHELVGVVSPMASASNSTGSSWKLCSVKDQSEPATRRRRFMLTKYV